MIDTKELQKYIIGSIIEQPDLLLSVTDIVTPADMSHQNGIILGHVLRLYTNGTPIDMGSVSHSLQESREIDKVGGMSYLMDCMDIPTTANVLYHARKVKKEALRAKIKAWGMVVAQRDLSGSVQDNLGVLERELLDMADAIKPKKSPEMKDIIKSLGDRQVKIDVAIESGKYDELWVPTNFWGDLIPAYHKGHFILITGYTSFGKSTLLNTLVVDICENGGKPLIFSLEDSSAEKVMGLRGVIANVPKSWQLQGDTLSSRGVLAEADEKLLEWKPIVYDDVRTLDDMRLKMKKHVLRDGVNVVAIDYVQNIKEQGSLFEKMNRASIFFQDTFKELGVTGIVLSQIDNASARDGGAIIGAKGGGDLPASADIVIQMQRQEGDRFALDLILKKNRAFGKTGMKPCKFNPRFTAIVPNTF